MKEILAKLVEGKDLTKEEAMKAQELILTGQATEAQIACFLTALRMKGETLDEITGLAAVLRNKANTISPKVADYVDFVGTGGDCTYSFNISTTSAFVVAAAGLPVAKQYLSVLISQTRKPILQILTTLFLYYIILENTGWKSLPLIWVEIFNFGWMSMIF